MLFINGITAPHDTYNDFSNDKAKSSLTRRRQKIFSAQLWRINSLKADYNSHSGARAQKLTTDWETWECQMCNLITHTFLSFLTINRTENYIRIVTRGNNAEMTEHYSRYVARMLHYKLRGKKSIEDAKSIEMR